jgi:membrane-bound ClpP family serine protease
VIDLRVAEDVLEAMERIPGDEVTVVLHTLGGCVTSCVLIANALRQFPQSTAIVPYMATSGGTLIALNARRLQMGRSAALSAVDPIVEGQRVKHLPEEPQDPTQALAHEYEAAITRYLRTRSWRVCPASTRRGCGTRWTCSWASTRRTSGRSAATRSSRSGSRSARRRRRMDEMVDAYRKRWWR